MNNEPSGKQPAKHPNLPGRAGTVKRNIVPLQRNKIGWGDVPNQLLRDTLVAVTDAGCAFLIGTTADRGALSITVLDGDSKVREYPHTLEEAEQTLRWLLSMYSTD